MADKMKSKQSDQDMPMDEENAEAFSNQDMKEDDDSESPSGLKGGQTTDEGLGEYEVGYFEAAGVLDDTDRDTWDESDGDGTNTKTRSQDEEEL